MLARDFASGPVATSVIYFMASTFLLRRGNSKEMNIATQHSFSIESCIIGNPESWFF